MGHLLYLTGVIDDKILSKYEKESKRMGKNTFHFAWALDEDSEERKRGVTVDIAYKHFETQTKQVTAMDAPGHRDFIPNMISGTSAADCAILVIDSNKNAFESGFFQGGQTREHAVLARTLGVKQIIVCVNKLEIWDWAQDRFEYIKAQVGSYLETLDFKERDITFIPISGLLGANLLKKSDDIKPLLWYEGKSLIDTIDSLEPPQRDIDAPVRFTISDSGITTIDSLQGFSIFGKLETGVIFEEKEYIVMPLNSKVKVRGKFEKSYLVLSINNNRQNVMVAGQSGELILVMEKNLMEEIKPGSILCSIENPIPVVNVIKTQIMTLEITAPLNVGQSLFVHCHSQKTNAKIKKIHKIFSKDGQITKLNPR